MLLGDKTAPGLEFDTQACRGVGHGIVEYYEAKRRLVHGHERNPRGVIQQGDGWWLAHDATAFETFTPWTDQIDHYLDHHLFCPCYGTLRRLLALAVT